MRDSKYWIIVASKDHVKKGIEGGFAQACHGKAGPLKRMRPNDHVIYYSGKEAFGKPEKCQQFTAIGKVKDSGVYQHQMSPEFCPSRREIEFFPGKDVSIIPLIGHLNFIKNKKSWGYPFRFGFFEIDKTDFDLIASKMLAEVHEKIS
ncbi:MAG: EVE domain-containing protein [Saprospiraceae bacterium]|nr:EVE domain-containing protein [Saprospiraceae bacterium]